MREWYENVPCTDKMDLIELVQCGITAGFLCELWPIVRFRKARDFLMIHVKFFYLQAIYYCVKYLLFKNGTVYAQSVFRLCFYGKKELTVKCNFCITWYKNITRQAVYVLCNIEACSSYHCFRGKANPFARSECVFVALVIQYAMRMRGCILPSVVCLILPCFSTLSHQRHDLKKTVIGLKRVFFIFSTAFF